MFQATSRMKVVAASTKVPTLVVQSISSAPSTGYMKEKRGIRGEGGGVRFVRSVQSHDPRKPRQFDNRFDNLDKAISKNHQDRDPSSSDDKATGDVMSSYGEGYATRSDEEGFGGIYGGSTSADNNNEDKILQEDHPAYDKTQGSQVKEKETGRNSIND